MPVHEVAKWKPRVLRPIPPRSSKRGQGRYPCERQHQTTAWSGLRNVECEALKTHSHDDDRFKQSTAQRRTHQWAGVRKKECVAITYGHNRGVILARMLGCLAGLYFVGLVHSEMAIWHP